MVILTYVNSRRFPNTGTSHGYADAHEALATARDDIRDALGFHLEWSGTSRAVITLLAPDSEGGYVLGTIRRQEG